MSSPPHSQTPLPLHNPRKRPSISSTSSHAKRLQALHPLRQVSLPTPGEGDARIFSATTPSAKSDAGSITGSLIGKTDKRGRGRPRKDGSVRGSVAGRPGAGRDGGEGASALDGGSVTELQPVGGAPSVVGGGEEGDDDDEAEEAAAFGDTEGGQDIIRDQWKYQVLESTFTEAQKARYELFRRVRFPKPRVQRIVNQTLSQSVTAPVVTFVNGYTKYFVGEIIEKARDVQDEWAKAWDNQNASEKRQAERPRAEEEKEGENRGKGLGSSGDSVGDRKSMTESPSSMTPNPLSAPPTPGVPQPPQPRTTQPQAPKETEANPHKGPILPDHLREALRRYKADGEGGGVGFGSLSLHGMGLQGDGVWRIGGGLGGRRLFR